MWGLPCNGHYWPPGALLPHLFTLTPPSRMRRYFLCGTFRPAVLKPPSRTLSGTLLYGVRTFLQAGLARPATARSNCQPEYYSGNPICLDLRAGGACTRARNAVRFGTQSAPVGGANDAVQRIGLEQVVRLQAPMGVVARSGGAAISCCSSAARKRGGVDAHPCFTGSVPGI